MSSHEKAREMIREVHPEVCFYDLAGRRSMRYSKNTRAGFSEHLMLLASLQPEVEQVVETALARCNCPARKRLEKALPM